MRNRQIDLRQKLTLPIYFEVDHEQSNEPETNREKTYLVYHRDGIWDITLGIAFKIDMVHLTGIWVVVLLPGIISVKKAFTEPRQDLGLMPFGFVIALILGVCGMVFGIYRFLAYGVLIMLCFVLGHNFETEIAAIFIFPGALFLIIGIVMLIIFMRKYPKKSRTEFEPFNYPQ